MAGNRTRINCLEGSYADHYTTIALHSVKQNFLLLRELRQNKISRIVYFHRNRAAQNFWR